MNSRKLREKSIARIELFDLAFLFFMRSGELKAIGYIGEQTKSHLIQV
jgi:hypothetical protein